MYYGARMYLVLGCTDIGFEIATKFKERGTEVTLVEPDAQKAGALGMTLNVFQGDFTSKEVLEKAGIKKAEVVFIATPERSLIERTLNAINLIKTECGIEPIVLSVVADELLEKWVRGLGADGCLPVTQSLVQSAFQEFEELGGVVKEKRLRALLHERMGRMVIVLQTNPDPDSIASAAALKRYAKAFGLGADIVYDGEMGYPQNRAMKNLLELELTRAEEVDFTLYSIIALVDVATHANCALPKHLIPTVVIDHHPVPSSEVRARFQDITITGATSSLLANYLRYSGVEMDRALAAALALGILTDTMNLTRNTTQLDFHALRFLVERADPDLLRRLQQSVVSPQAFDVLARAIKASKITAGYLTANVGAIDDPDSVAQVAEFLIQQEGVKTALVYGILRDVIRISARTTDPSLHLGHCLREAFGEFAGGHASMAGGRVPTSLVKPAQKRTLRAAVDNVIRRRFLEVVGVLKPRKKRRKF